MTDARARLEAIGILLYGSRWQSDLAKALGVSDRQVRRWVAGDTKVPDRALLQIQAIAQKRARALQKLLALLPPH